MLKTKNLFKKDKTAPFFDVLKPNADNIFHKSPADIKSIEQGKN